MRCAAARMRLRGHLDRELEGREGPEVARHLERCAECARALARLVDDERAGEDLAPVRALLALALPAGRESGVARRARRRSGVAPARLAAAGLVLAAAIAAAWFLRRDGKGGTDEPDALLALLRRGAAASELTYRRFRPGDAEGARVVLAAGGRWFAEADREDGGGAATGGRGALQWAFDRGEDRLVLEARPATAAFPLPSPDAGAALADLFARHYRLGDLPPDAAGGVVCRVLAAARRAEAPPSLPLEVTLHVDPASRVIRRERLVYGDRTEVFELVAASQEATAIFLPKAFITASTRIEIAFAAGGSAAFDLSGLAAEVLGSGGAAELAVPADLAADLAILVKELLLPIGAGSDPHLAPAGPFVLPAEPPAGAPAALRTPLPAGTLDGCRDLRDLARRVAAATGVTIECRVDGGSPLMLFPADDLPAWTVLEIAARLQGAALTIDSGRVMIDRR